MTNQNGQLVLQALEDLEEPATITKIINYIAETVGVNPSEVENSVKETLEVGLRFGYVQRTNRKYYTAPLDVDALSEADLERIRESAGVLEDKSRRIRRGRIGRRRRDGSRRHRRRSSRS